MAYRYYLIPVLSLCLLAACQKISEKTVIDPDLGYQTVYTITSGDTIYNGPYRKTDGDGKLLESGHYRAGELHGIRELYYPDGKVKVRERYVNGRIDDLYEYFHPNGKIELQGYYVNGEMYGLWKKYSPEGELIEKVTMAKNEEMGPFVEFHPNGKIQAEGTYLHGANEDGELKLYDESGELYKKMWCDSGICRTQWERQ